jgi:hypothetical protein
MRKVRGFFASLAGWCLPGWIFEFFGSENSAMCGTLQIFV